MASWSPWRSTSRATDALVGGPLRPLARHGVEGELGDLKKPELAAVVGAERFLAEIGTTANPPHPEGPRRARLRVREWESSTTTSSRGQTKRHTSRACLLRYGVT